MQTRPGGRRLAAILSADGVGYSRLVSINEDSAVQILRTYRAIIPDLVAEHDGRIFGTAGDSIIAEFASAVQAVRSAVAIQRALDHHNADLLSDRRMSDRSVKQEGVGITSEIKANPTHPSIRRLLPLLRAPRCGVKTRAGTPCRSPRVKG